MGIFFKDEFEGSGPLSGHAPDVGFSVDDYWDDGSTSHNLVLSGGYVENTGAGPGNATYAAETAGANPLQFTIDFTFVTPPSVELDGSTAPMGFGLGMNLDDDYPGDALYVELRTQYGYDWVFALGDNSDEMSEIITTLEPNTEYAGRITSSAEGSSATMFGVTFTLPTPRALVGGVRSFDLTLGNGCKIGAIVGEAIEYDGEIGVGVADLSAPPARLRTSSATPASSHLFFSDEFEGSGSIIGHTPEIEIGVGAAWEQRGPGSTNLAGGFAVNLAEYNPSRFGYSAFDADESPGEFRVDFTFVTGPSVDIDEVYPLGFYLYIYMDKAYPFSQVALRFYVDYDLGGWVVDLSDGTGDPPAGHEIVYPEADTEYTATIIVTAESVTAALFNQGFVLPTERPAAGGVSGFEITIGTGYKVDRLVGSFLDTEPPVEVGIGDADLIAPMGTLRAGDGNKGTAALIAPMALVLAGDGDKGAAMLVAPAALIEATGRDASGDNALAGTAPAPLLVAFGAATSRLTAPRPVLSLAGTAWGQGCATLAPQPPLIVANGRASGTAAAALRAPAGRLVGYAGAVCSIRVGGATIQVTGTAGAVGRAALTLPLFELAAAGGRQNHGGAQLLAPAARLGATAQAWLVAPGARLAAIGTAVVAVSYEAYSINLSHHDPEAVDEVTRYTNFPFERIVRYQGSYFGVAFDGLYLLEGTTDDGAAIAYEVKTCMDDFKAPQRKTMASAYLSGRLGPASTVTLYAGEDGAQSHAHETPRGPAAQNHRQKFGRGVKDRYFALGLAGDGALALDAIEPEILTLKRRI